MNASLVVACFAAGIAWADPPAPVKTTGLRPVTWRATIDVAASIDAEQEAAIGAERPGRVVAVLYRSGETVAAGALLVKLDDGAEAAQLDVDTAKLTQAGQAMARSEKLMSIAGSSQAALEQAEADAAEAKAQVAFDQAALAQLNISAPFAGTLGIRKISAGDYVSQGQVVAQMTQTAPLRVLFSVPQTEAGGISVGDGFALQTASVPGDAIVASGKIIALSPMVDAATDARDGEGMVTAGAAGLLPGMAGEVTLATGAPRPAYMVPGAALNDSVLGRYLFVLARAAGGFTLKTVYVTEYSQSGADAVIGTDGLAPDDKIVALGGFKLQDGAAVTPESP